MTDHESLAERLADLHDRFAPERIDAVVRVVPALKAYIERRNLAADVVEPGRFAFAAAELLNDLVLGIPGFPPFEDVVAMARRLANAPAGELDPETADAIATGPAQAVRGCG